MKQIFAEYLLCDQYYLGPRDIPVNKASIPALVELIF